MLRSYLLTVWRALRRRPGFSALNVIGLAVGLACVILICKALGATATHIVSLLSHNFLALMGIAFVVAVPVAYLAMQQWLATFAYRVEIGVGVFVATGLLAALVAGLSVSYQAWTAAQTRSGPHPPR